MSQKEHGVPIGRDNTLDCIRSAKRKIALQPSQRALWIQFVERNARCGSAMQIDWRALWRRRDGEARQWDLQGWSPAYSRCVCERLLRDFLGAFVPSSGTGRSVLVERDVRHFFIHADRGNGGERGKVRSRSNELSVVASSVSTMSIFPRPHTGHRRRVFSLSHG